MGDGARARRPPAARAHIDLADGCEEGGDEERGAPHGGGVALDEGNDPKGVEKACGEEVETDAVEKRCLVVLWPEELVDDESTLQAVDGAPDAERGACGGDLGLVLVADGANAEVGEKAGGAEAVQAKRDDEGEGVGDLELHERHAVVGA